MADLISRAAAIDALDVLCQEHRYRIPGKRETYSQYNEAWQDALDRAEGVIGIIPSAQPSYSCSHENDTISRTAAIDATWFEPSYTDPLNVLTEVRDRLKVLPPAQPERKKGKWIAVTEDGDVYKRICSCCGREAFFQNDDPDELYDGGRYELSDFCPHCGADMRKDEQE